MTTPFSVDYLPLSAQHALIAAWAIIDGDFSQREYDMALSVLRALIDCNTEILSARSALTTSLTASRAHSRLADHADKVASLAQELAYNNTSLTNMLRAEIHGTLFDGELEEFSDGSTPEEA